MGLQNKLNVGVIACTRIHIQVYSAFYFESI